MSDDAWAAPSSDLAGDPLADFDGGEFLPADSTSRFIAYIVDSFALGIVIFGMAFSLALVLEVASPGALDREVGNAIDLFTRIGSFGLTVVYGTVFEASGWRGTPGKRLMGIEVAEQDGTPLTWERALGRNVWKGIMLSCCGLLALTALSGGNGLWNDQARTRVIKRLDFV